jgi:hypothetical protein
MVVKNSGWELPHRKPITGEVLDRVIAAEEEIAPLEHHAQHAWVDRNHDLVMMLLTDGRVFGAARRLIPSLQDASTRGAFLVVPDLDLHISVDGLVTRLMEESPATIRRAGARLAGKTTSTLKAAAAARNGKLGGRPKKEQRLAGKRHEAIS